MIVPTRLMPLSFVPRRGGARSGSAELIHPPMAKTFLVFIVIAGLAAPVSAQQRPLVTEDPETVGAGLVLLEGGFDYQQSVFYPVSGLEGNLLRLPTLGVSFGLSSIAELQIDGGLYNRLSMTSRQAAPLSGALDFTGDHPHDVEDIDIGTKIRVAAERPGRPAVRACASRRGCRTRATRAAWASTRPTSTPRCSSARPCSRCGWSAMLGFGILGGSGRWRTARTTCSPTVCRCARAVEEGVEIVGEINGRVDTARRRAAARHREPRQMRVGGAVPVRRVRRSGIIFGLTSRDPSFGLTGGAHLGVQGVTVPIGHRQSAVRGRHSGLAGRVESRRRRRQRRSPRPCARRSIPAPSAAIRARAATASSPGAGLAEAGPADDDVCEAQRHLVANGVDDFGADGLDVRRHRRASARRARASAARCRRPLGVARDQVAKRRQRHVEVRRSRAVSIASAS